MSRVPELAPQLIRPRASGRADRLSGRYIHAEDVDIEDLQRNSCFVARGSVSTQSRRHWSEGVWSRRRI